MSDEDIEGDFEDIDFDDAGFGDEAGFDDFNTTGSSASALKDNPMVKIGGVLAVLAVIIGAVVVFGGGSDGPDNSSLRPAPQVENAIPTDESTVSEVYKEQLQTRNQQAVEEAQRTGGSVLPVTANTAKGKIELEVEEEPEEDPLERWRMLQEQRKKARPEPVVQQQVQQPQTNQVDTRAQAVTAMSDAMSTQMQSILDAQKVPPLKVSQITPVEYIEDMVKEAEEAALKEEEARKQTAEEATEIILLPAGEIEYGQLITEANSDVPGPILAKVASGPLKGSKLLGKFETKKEHLILSFNQIVIDGISYDVDAVAIDPNSALPGMATEVDHRYFTRVVLPAAAAFIEGVAGAVAQSESTTVTVGDTSTSSTQQDLDLTQELASGGEELAREVGQELDNIANQTMPLIRVAAGTPMGILFVEPVIED
jgi:intracellular multiplication protein IcmE